MPHHHAAAIGRRPRSLPLSARLPSPGVLYNAGNLLGLCVGLAVTFVGHGGRSGETLAAYFAGDGSALCLTAATIVFFVSGSIYHRAWQVGGAQRLRLVRCADLLSGLGAILLGASLFLVGQPILALASATLHSTGKLGSSLAGGRSEPLCRLARRLVLGSRAFGLLAGASALPSASGASASDIVMSATLVVCYLLWASADILLMKYAD